MSGYRGGHILRIKVTNFMTYDELEIYPKPGLNLVIGLNGSGKSSIMCAICLGLAGKPQFTGRSAQLSDFIKYGCNKATIDIELENPSKRNVVISRIIQNDKSTWLLNRSEAPLSEIQKAVRKFNIDVSNLCQFLPQEKVTEFSKMDKKQRLENMLQAIGDPKLFSTFVELKQMKVNSVKLEEVKKRHESHKESEEQKNQRLKVEVDKHEEKLRMKEHLNTLQQHKMVLDYEEITKNLKALKNDREPLVNQLKTAEHSMQTIISRNSTKTKKLHEAVDELKKLKVSISKHQETVVIKEAEMGQLHEQVANVKIHYQNKIEEKRNQLAKLSEIAKQRQALQELHNNNLAERPEILEKNAEISQKLGVIKNQLSALSSEHAYTNLEKNKLEYSIKEILNEVKKMENEENKKMEFLRQRFRDVYEGVVWLQENKQRFRSTVHPPMLLSLKINADENRKFIENHVSLRDLLAFICEDKEDNKLLTKILRTQKNLYVDIVMVPDYPLEFYKSPNVTSDLRKLGINCFLKDIIDASDAVKCFLCHCYGLHTTPLCSAAAERNTDYIFNNIPQIKSFFTPDSKISGKRSKYGSRNLCIRKDNIRPKNILPSSRDHSDQLELLKNKLQNEYDLMNVLVGKLQKSGEQIRELESQENALRNEKKFLNEKLQVFVNTERQLEQKIQSYERRKSEVVNEEVEKSRVLDTIQKINQERKIICMNISDALEKFILAKQEKLKFNLKARIFQKALAGAKSLQVEKERELKELAEKLDALNTTKKELIRKGKDLYREIQVWHDAYQEKRRKMTDMCKNVGKRILQSLGMNNSLKSKNKSNFEIKNDEYYLPSLPESLSEDVINFGTKEDCEKEIRRVQAQLDLNSEENGAVTVEYEERKKRIAEAEVEIKNYEQNLTELQDQMTNKKNEWLPQLMKHIQNINTRFSEYYKQLRCSGEISLDTCNDTDDFPKYGLQISLKYRDNEPLMELSNTHHSGGECSVAAIIFILSLQGLTEVPFRCIDEINQGMDSHNERNIYDLIAKSAKSESCSQYFLLTPKLLMDLEMIQHKDVAVHVIYNSCFLEMKMDVQEHLKSVGKN